MKITRITLSGADDNIDPAALLKLSQEHERIEWGILMSKKREGQAKYPARPWLKWFARLEGENPGVLKTSAHLCGEWARTAAAGEWTAMNDCAKFISNYDRIQVNLCDTKVDPAVFARSLTRGAVLGRQIILQYGKGREDIERVILTPGCDVVPLFDRSGGNGILPDKWPHQFKKVVQTGSGARTVKELIRGRETYVYCGYAGGLNPENIREQLEKIAAAAPGNIWIDVESGIRDGTNNFCLAKIRAFLDAVYAFERT